MANDAMPPGGSGASVLDRWTARKVQPVVVLYVVAVFAAFAVVSIVVFQSPKAVMALALAAAGAVAATVPGVLEKVEYRLTTSGVEKRSADPRKPRRFEEAFRWDQLSHVVPVRQGFKYFKVLNETNPVRRIWKTHLCDEFSGEIHVEKADLARVLELVERQQFTAHIAADPD